MPNTKPKSDKSAARPILELHSFGFLRALGVSAVNLELFLAQLRKVESDE
jgi:hypothetical protein